MKKIMNPTIEVAPDFLMQQFGWAMRYCVNPSTYAVEDCIDMALYIHANRDKFNSERVKFQPRDLICEANTRLGWKKNVHIEANDNCTVNFSAYYQIAEYLSQHPDLRFCDYDWWVDCVSGYLHKSKLAKPLTDPYGGLATLYDYDIETVCIATDIIDPDKHFRVTTFHNGHEETNECIKSFMAEQIYDEQKHTTVDYKYTEVYRLIRSPHSWAAPEYITKIEKI